MPQAYTRPINDSPAIINSSEYILVESIYDSFVHVVLVHSLPCHI